MISASILWVGLGAWVWSMVMTPIVRHYAVLRGYVSRPTQDRWGHRVVARLGGLPIALVFLAVTGFGIHYDSRLLGLFLGGLLMLFTGLVDDIRRLHPYSKLIAQIVAGCLVVLAEVQFPFKIPWLVIPLTIGWLVLVMNAFNLIDNMDGLSAGIGAMAAAFCIWQAAQFGQWLLVAISASLLGSTVGFLRYNFPPAKIFMGDTGSQILGLGLGAMALMGSWHQSTRLLGILALPTLLLSVPIFDTCFVTVQRILHGRHPFQGGTDHLSHRLSILGLTTRQVVFVLYVLSAAFGVLSVTIPSKSLLAISGIWFATVGLLLLLGVYLAKVRVYSDCSTPFPDSPMTLIETTLLHKVRLMEICIDFVLICAAYIIANVLRFEANITGDLELLILKSLPWIIAIKMLCFLFCGLYRGVRRYTSLSDLVNIFRAVLLGSVLSALMILFLWRFQGYSRAVFIIDGLFLFVALSGARIAERLFDEWIMASARGGIPALIVGAGDTGELLLRHLKQSVPSKYKIIGFLDDSLASMGVRIHGIPILGSRQNLGRIVQQFQIREIFIAMCQPPADLVQQIQGYCQENNISCRVVTVMASLESSILSDP